MGGFGLCFKIFWMWYVDFYFVSWRFNVSYIVGLGVYFIVYWILKLYIEY